MIRLATFTEKTEWQMELDCCQVLQKHFLKSLAYAGVDRKYTRHRTLLGGSSFFSGLPLLPLSVNRQSCISMKNRQMNLSRVLILPKKSQS